MLRPCPRKLAIDVLLSGGLRHERHQTETFLSGQYDEVRFERVYMNVSIDLGKSGVVRNAGAAQYGQGTAQQGNSLEHGNIPWGSPTI